MDNKSVARRAKILTSTVAMVLLVILTVIFSPDSWATFVQLEAIALTVLLSLVIGYAPLGRRRIGSRTNHKPPTP